MSWCWSAGATTPMAPRPNCPRSATNCAGTFRQGLVQDWSVQTYTLRYNRSETALPVRWMEAFLPGEGLGGAANHWNGHTWRWSEYEPQIRTRNETRYGKQAIPKDVPLQDWGTTYAEMRPYHEVFEKLFGLAGKAGNIQGKIQEGGNPFEAPRDGEFPQKPLEFTESRPGFQGHSRAHGLQALSDTGSQLIRRLHQPRWTKARGLPVLRPLRALYLRSQGQGVSRSPALSHAEGA